MNRNKVYTTTAIIGFIIALIFTIIDVPKSTNTLLGIILINIYYLIMYVFATYFFHDVWAATKICSPMLVLLIIGLLLKNNLDAFGAWIIKFTFWGITISVLLFEHEYYSDKPNPNKKVDDSTNNNEESNKVDEKEKYANKQAFNEILYNKKSIKEDLSVEGYDINKYNDLTKKLIQQLFEYKVIQKPVFLSLENDKYLSKIAYKILIDNNVLPEYNKDNFVNLCKNMICAGIFAGNSQVGFGKAIQDYDDKEISKIKLIWEEKDIYKESIDNIAEMPIKGYCTKKDKENLIDLVSKNATYAFCTILKDENNLDDDDKKQVDLFASLMFNLGYTIIANANID